MRSITRVLEATGFLLLLFNPSTLHVQANTITPAPKATSSVSGISNKSETPQTQTCEFRTINYITDSLPQQCLRSTWSSTNTTVPTSADTTVTSDGLAVESRLVLPRADTLQEGNSNGEGVAIPVTNVNISVTPSGTTPDTSATDLEPGELNDASFLSFEEWKKQTLEKAGQDKNANIGNKKAEKKKEDKDFQNSLDSLGDEGEIELNFGTFRGGESPKAEAKSLEESERKRDEKSDEALPERETKDQHRNKDAGKTCKERFSYASFDAGATILKTHPGAKNSKAVLIENKDSYMLSECAAENKFIIIELSEDIWIDTLVLANYEFFSSMVRTFRVSVSDRYPVKIEKWKDIGTYEARNSRDIQAFLIENPQIWARYIRIEFLSHFGSEYYCPLSLVRVHGARMLESWKETEAADEDPEEETEMGGEEEEEEEQFIHDAVADVIKEQEKVQAEIARLAQLVSNSAHNITVEVTQKHVTAETGMTPWKKPGFYLFEFDDPTERDDICLLAEAPPWSETVVEVLPTAKITPPATSNPPVVTDSTPTLIDTTAPATTISIPKSEKPLKVDIAAVKGSSTVNSSTMDLTSPSAASSTSASSIIGLANTKPHNTTVFHKNKTATSTSSHPALPTIQESFFKAVSRRLQLLETNSTLSLAYIEEQSKILREAFNRVSSKQVAKTNSFVDGMNATMFTELREIRQQYDQIWQSTIISLESQREESRREMLAISTRLNILADEVVFQKRMSIVQSILLILCLGLVIFSRVSSGGNMEFPTMYSRSRGVSVYPLDSPTDIESPNFRRSDSLRNGKWLEVDHRRRRHESPEQAPLTPTSVNSPERSGPDTNDNTLAGTPTSGADELLDGHSNGNDVQISVSSPETTELHEHKSQSPKRARASLTSPNGTTRTPKKRRAFIRQHGNSNSYEGPNQEASPRPSDLSTFSDVDTSATSFPSPDETTLPRSRSVDIISPTSRLPSPPTDTEPGFGDETGNGDLRHELGGIAEPEKQEQGDEGWQAVSPKPAKSTKGKRRFSIARKPLPALPNDS